MNPPVLADPPAPPTPETPLAPEAAASAPRACAHCGAALAPAQDWCLECGAGMPGALDRRPPWRSAAAIIALAVLLVAGAVTAGYAALRSDSRRAVRVAQAPVPAPAAAAPAPVTPPAATPATPAVPPAAGTKAPVAPKLPAATPTPTPAPGAAKPAVPATPVPTGHPATPAAPSAPPPSAPSSGSGSSSGATAPQPGTGRKILLDTDAASTYNPYGYDPSRFGDPSLAIDGDPSTSWTAAVDPATAPKLAVGLDINLKSAQSVSKLDLSTSTPGMVVEIYGTAGSQPPSITDPAWVHLAPPRAITRHAKIVLDAGGRRFRHLVVWITRAPAGHSAVAIGELSVIR